MISARRASALLSVVIIWSLEERLVTMATMTVLMGKLYKKRLMPFNTRCDCHC
jgi:hypothetical protein